MVLSSVAVPSCPPRFSEVFKKGNLDMRLEFEGARRCEGDGVGEVSRCVRAVSSMVARGSDRRVRVVGGCRWDASKTLDH